MHTTSNDLTPAATILEGIYAADIPAPDVQINWHTMSEQQAADILALFPTCTWTAHASGSMEWISTNYHGVSLTIFLAATEPIPPRRATSILAAALEAASR
jgi:hypothetical protein